MDSPGDAVAARFDDRGFDARIPCSFRVVPTLGRIGQQTGMAIAIVSLLYGGLVALGYVLGIDAPRILPPLYPFWALILLMAATFAFYSAQHVQSVQLRVDIEGLTITRQGGRSVTTRVFISHVRAVHRTPDRIRIVTNDNDVFLPTQLIPEDSAVWLVEQIDGFRTRSEARSGEPDERIRSLRAQSAGHRNIPIPSQVVP